MEESYKIFYPQKYSKKTELSKHTWHLKQKNIDFIINWSIQKIQFLTRENLKDIIYVYRKNLVQET